MATNNLLVNNEFKVLREEQQKVERSAHNLSQSRKFPCEVGVIYPFFCRKTLPSDSFKIWSNILIKQLQPLLVPQMVSFTVNTAFYWVDYNLAFPDFESFLINQKGSQSVELPYVHLQSSGFLVNADLLPPVAPVSSSGSSIFPLNRNVRSFLDISINGSNEKVDALPFWTYLTIKRDFYTNLDRLDDTSYKTWFPSNSNDWKLKPGENFAVGDFTVSSDGTNYTYTGNYMPFDSLFSHEVRGDYFVNSYPTPLRGDIPVLEQDVNVTNFSAKINAILDLESIVNKPILVSPPSGVFEQTSGNYPEIRENPNGQGFAIFGDVATDNPKQLYSNAQNSNDSFGAINSNFAKLLRYLNGTNNVLFSDVSNLTTSFNVSSRQLRLLESLTRKREIDILMKPRLKNYLQTYFGVNRYKDDSLYQPVFIGSTTQQILINDIAQTTGTSDSPLGRQGATAMSLGSGYVGEFYCRNYGCLMGVMYILPDFDYEPALPKEWTERVPDEFVNPEFTHLSMSPILNKELFVSSDDNWNNQVLGYGGMYDNYRTSQNLVCGEFLNPNYTDIRQFAQVRRFDNSNKPEITPSFLDSSTAFDKTVFSVPTMPPFIAQCVARVEAVRPLPQVAIPRG